MTTEKKKRAEFVLTAEAVEKLQQLAAYHKKQKSDVIADLILSEKMDQIIVLQSDITAVKQQQEIAQANHEYLANNLVALNQEIASLRDALAHFNKS